MEPVDQFDVGVAPQLAEHCGGFDGLVGEAVQFAEQRGAADFAHVVVSSVRGLEGLSKA